jgi:hypothetical protein
MNKSPFTIGFVCVLIIFVILLVQSFCGGPMFTLTIRSGHYFLFDHNRYTEISIGELKFLAILSAIAVLAIFIGIISVICILVQMLKLGVLATLHRGGLNSRLNWLQRTGFNVVKTHEKESSSKISGPNTNDTDDHQK